MAAPASNGAPSAAPPQASPGNTAGKPSKLPLFGVSCNEAGWQAAIHTVVHRLGRHFGFQAFNLDPRSEGKEPVYIPATIFLVTDHLYHLLVKNYLRRDKAAGSDDDRWTRAVYRLHATIFQGYRDWCRHVDLPERINELTLEKLRESGEAMEWEYLLEELALWFLLYSEGANLRHVPEALWFLYWCLRNSHEKQMQITVPAPSDPRSAAYIARTPELAKDLMKLRIHLRNKYQKQIDEWRHEQGAKADGEMRSIEELSRIHQEVKKSILASGLIDSGRGRDVNMVAEMVAYGDSGAFLDRLVTPIFAFLAVEVDMKGTNKVEIGCRTTYCDVNESLCRADVVHKTLGRLGVQWDKKTRSMRVPRDLYANLLAVGEVTLAGGEPSTGADGAAPGPVRLGYDGKLARDWWDKFVFGKTFVERRSLFSMYRTFYRVWAFLILEFHMMAVLVWGWDLTKAQNFYPLCSVALDHAFLSLVEQFAGAWTQRSLFKGQKVLGSPFWGRYSRGLVDWLVINAVLYLALVAQITEFFSFPIFYYIAAGYTGLVIIHAVITTRDGYCISLSNQLAARLRRWRRDPRSCCGSGWGPFIWVLERVGASSARPVAQEYLAPYHMKTGWDNFFSNLLFWVCTLGAKCAFDWFALMKPLDRPVRALWGNGWLSVSNNAAADGDFLLVIARCLPSFIVMFNDAQVFYLIVLAVFGSLKGIVQLNLGSITTFQEVVISFHKAPKRWWESCTSAKGKENLFRAIDGLAAGAGTVPRRGTGEYNMPGVHVNQGTLGALQMKRAVDRNRLSHTERLLQNTQELVKQSEADKALAYFEDNRVAMWLVFSDVWNAIVEELRSIDHVSDYERDNLVFVHLDIDPSIEILDGMRPFMMPIFFYGGQISKAMESPSLSAAQQVALTEIRSLLVWLLMQLNIISREQAEAFLHFEPLARPSNIDHRASRTSGVGEVAKLLKQLQSLTGKAVDEAMRRNRWNSAMGVRGCITKLFSILKKEAKAVLDEHKRAPRTAADTNKGRQMHHHAQHLLQVLAEVEKDKLEEWRWNAFVGEEQALDGLYAEAPDTPAKRCILKVIKQVVKMLETSAKMAQPRGTEAQRVLSVFAGSLKNPTLEKPPCIEEMLSFNTLTPHYEEDVIYALNAASVARHFGMDPASARGMSDLMRENEDGVSVMQWLRSAYDQDWKNLLERLKPKLGGLDPRYVTDADFDVGGPLHHVQMELLLWASYRGQLLARTVRGMMAYEKAIRLLAHLECPQPPGMSDVKYLSLVDDVCRSKFTYVVASQVYAANRYSSSPKGRWLARGVDILLHQYPSLRVAFIDTFNGAQGTQQYSVLIRGQVGTPAGDPEGTQELYRVRLPRNSETGHGIVLGEGKPENQNAAVIFCFGEVIQAIDMNQDNYLAEAVKMRNLINEFNPPIYNDMTAAAGAAIASARRPANGRPLPLAVDARHGGGTEFVRVGEQYLERPWPEFNHKPVALVGFREWVFSQDSGALAGFAASTEFTFGSIVQRVMTWPGSVRFHYGHPDLWNKLFIMTRGGVSKATRAFHISEDVFAGYNHVQRSGNVKFKEYISVGKGRDMGFDSINSFESKVSGGNGEQVISRDVHRLATQFDFFRLMSFYHSGCGFFINTYLVMLSVYINIWTILLLALTTPSYMVPDPDNPTEMINVLTGTASSVSIQQIIQLGMFSIITYAVELLLEYGFAKMVATVLMQIVQGSLAFFIFRSRTTAFFFCNDVQYGGAKYIPTGRGYAIKHNSFVKVYTSYARSHLYYAAELLLLAILLMLVDMTSYAGIAWSTWMVSVAILWAPFWFNPQTFQLERCKDDFEAWVLWMRDVTDTSTNSTWFSWNKGQLEKARNDAGTQTNPLATVARGVLSGVPTALLIVASITRLQDTRYNKWYVFGTLSGGFWLSMLLVVLLRRVLLSHYQYRTWRLVRTFVAIGIVAFLVCIIVFLPEQLSGGVGIKNLILIVFANFGAASFLVQVLLYAFRSSLTARRIVDLAYRTMDWFLGWFLFVFLFLLSFLYFVDKVQGALLYNFKFAKMLERSRLLEANYLTSYVDRAAERQKKTLKEELVAEMARDGSSKSASLKPAASGGSEKHA
ncbi:Callose synthase 5 [Micractinium conductrix]|uniref:1,3-beta-glucan synthase n=1 Tax=Micractinium conductrix TaxID=554055 RepID=A0A2P6V639_9CHLO|nr:Callose synthase 5 [Micractinium conductrix]|eukprot:PSC69540.1 Callose synthase 5 [Micractinium conductrix]